MDPEKIAVTREWSITKGKHEVRSCIYYWRYVPGFATLAKPLTRLTEGRKDCEWDLKCQQAFEELENALSSAPILRYPRS